MMQTFPLNINDTVECATSPFGQFEMMQKRNPKRAYQMMTLDEKYTFWLKLAEIYVCVAHRTPRGAATTI
jgi:hypothetical protein